MMFKLMFDFSLMAGMAETCLNGNTSLQLLCGEASHCVISQQHCMRNGVMSDAVIACHQAKSATSGSSVFHPTELNSGH